MRQFPENGLKLLLEGSANVHDLLALAQPDLVPLVDFDRLQLVRTSFVARDFRHVEADVVLRDRGQRPGRSLVWLYVLLEHQSRPDRLMPLRLLDYLVQIIKGHCGPGRRRIVRCRALSSSRCCRLSCTQAMSVGNLWDG